VFGEQLLEGERGVVVGGRDFSELTSRCKLGRSRVNGICDACF
jgi:hypothetical protein